MKLKKNQKKNKRKKNWREIYFTIQVNLHKKQIQINIGVCELKSYFSEEDSVLMKCYYEKKIQI